MGRQFALGKGAIVIRRYRNISTSVRNIVSGIICILILGGLALPTFAESRFVPLMPKKRFAPTYPTAAREKGYEGKITVCFTVLSNGRVGDVRAKEFKFTAPIPGNAPPSVTIIKKARSLLGDAAIAATRQDRFFPATRNGRPVETKDVCQQYTFEPPSKVATPKYRPASPMVRLGVYYPSYARWKGYEGVLRICFTVLKNGDVARAHVAGFKLTAPLPKNGPPNPAAVAQARSLFGKTVLFTVPQEKFFPRLIDGKPVNTNNVCEKYHFTRYRAPWPSSLSAPYK